LITNAIMAVAILLGSTSPQEPRAPIKHKEAPKTAKCPQFWDTALQVGWKWKDLEKLDKIMYRESRCKPVAFNKKDPNGGSRGLVQINGFWTPWLKQRGVLSPPKASQGLFNPAINLLAALHIYNYGVDRYGEGWGPWRV
jgi:soluble lytic murein transglycosylase-like protein